MITITSYAQYCSKRKWMKMHVCTYLRSYEGIFGIVTQSSSTVTPAEAIGTFFAFWCLRASDYGCGLWTQRSSTDTSVTFHDHIDIRSVDLNNLSARSCKVFNTRGKVMNIFFRRHSLAGLVSSKFWLKCWKPAESLLGTWELITKSQTTDVSFHWVCETVTIICLNPLQETIESLFHPEKNEAD